MKEYIRSIQVDKSERKDLALGVLHKGITKLLTNFYLRYMKEMLREHIEKVVSLTDEEYETVRAHFVEKNWKKGAFLI